MGKIKAIGCYIGIDDPEEMAKYLESDDPRGKWRGQRAVDLIRANSGIGSQFRVLLKDMKYVNIFRGIVDKSKSHTKNFHFLEISQEDVTDDVYIVALTVNWATFSHRIENGEYVALYREMYGSPLDFIRNYLYANPDINEIQSKLKLSLDFYNNWKKAVKQNVSKRAELLAKDLEISIEGVLKEVGGCTPKN